MADEDEIYEGDEGYEDGEEFYEEEEMSPFMSALNDELRQAPWYLGSAVFHMFVLLILLLVPTQQPPEEQKKIVIQTKMLEEEEEEEEEIKPPEPQDTTDPLEEVMQETETLVNSTEKSITPNIDANVEISTDITAEVMTDDIMGDPSEAEIADAGEESAPSLMGVSAGAFSRHAGVGSSFRGGLGKLGKGLKGMIGRRPRGYGSSKGLCLVWVLDQSNSMKDDQEAVAKQAQDIQELLTDGGRKRMVSAVVAYENKPTMLQEPTKSAARIAEVIANVPPATSGQENVCRAISYACEAVMAKHQGWTRVIVLMSDENGDDTRGYAPAELTGGTKLTWHNYALVQMTKNRTRLFVIGKESPFQASSVWESFVDPTGYKHTLPASRGPESARIEIPIGIAVHNFGGNRSNNGRMPSGYGVYDLTYLAKNSKGAYFIVDESQDARRPMRESEKRRYPTRIDWEVMENYAPLMCARENYVKEMSKTKYGRGVINLMRVFGGAKNIGRGTGRVHPPSRYGGYLAGLRNRSAMLNKLVGIVRENLASDEALENADNRRQIANLDCWMVALLSDQIVTENFLNAYEAYSGETPNDKFKHLVMVDRPGGPTQEERDWYNKKVRQLRDACDEVVRRHRNTPWAACAQWVWTSGMYRKYGKPRILELRPYNPPPPPKHKKKPPEKYRHL